MKTNFKYETFAFVNELEWNEKLFGGSCWIVKHIISIRRDYVVSVESSFADGGFKVYLINGCHFITHKEEVARLY